MSKCLSVSVTTPIMDKWRCVAWSTSHVPHPTFHIPLSTYYVPRPTFHVPRSMFHVPRPTFHVHVSGETITWAWQWTTSRRTCRRGSRVSSSTSKFGSELNIEVNKSCKWGSLQKTNTENWKQIFPEKELRGHSPNFHIHVSLSDLHIPTIDLPILLQEICGPILGIYEYKSLTEIGTELRNSQKRNT